MDISWIDDGALEATDGNGKMLGFPTGIPQRRFASADTIAMKRSEGIIVDADGRVASWPLIRFTEHEGKVAALGPWIEGTRPFDAGGADTADLAGLLSLARALKIREFPLSGLYIPALRRLGGGGYLLFPPLLACFAREMHPAAGIHDDWESWTHPDLAGEEGWSFSLGVLAWKILTGGDPYADERGEDRRERIRKGFVGRLEITVPAIEPDASALIRTALVGGPEGRPSLEAWDRLAERWLERGITVDLSETEAEENRARAVRDAEAQDRRLRNRRWFRRSGWKAAAVIGAVIAVVAIGATPLKRALEAPVTAGMEPMEVAKTYYEALNALDSETMGDCLAKHVGKEDVRRVDMIFVTHKVRQGYEGLRDLPNAAEWLAAGKPELPEGIWPWGVTDLDITELGDGRIEARYLLWMPREGEEAAGKPMGTPMTDILSFNETRRSWEIVGIDRSGGM